MGTITKSLELLNLFSRARAEIGLSEFVRLAGRDKATVHRHLTELEQNGFLEQLPVSRRYRLGPAILRLTAVREATHPLRSVLRPIVEQLAQQVGELCHSSILQGPALSPVCHADPQIHGTQVHFQEGEMLPMHATSSGLAVLAFSPPDFVARILDQPLVAHTEHTMTDATAIRALLAQVRQSGTCSLDQAFDSEVCSIGGPIFGPDGAPVGALAVAMPTARATPEKRAHLRQALLGTMDQATRSLGGTAPQIPEAG